MPLRYEDVELYVLAAAVPVVLLSLFSLFRWHYLRAVERAIHAEAPASGSSGAARRAASRTNRSGWSVSTWLRGGSRPVQHPWWLSRPHGSARNARPHERRAYSSGSTFISLAVRVLTIHSVTPVAS